MAIPLRLTSDGRVEVDAHLISARHRARGSVAFVIDTGSQKTILGARDAVTLGFPTEAFVPYAGSTMFGIGGRGKALDAGRCQIILGGGGREADLDIIYPPSAPEPK